MNRNTALDLMEKMETLDPADRDLRQRFVLRWLTSEPAGRPSGDRGGDTEARIKTLLGALQR